MQLHGAFNIHKEHRDLLTLAFQGGAGRPELLSQGHVIWCLGIGHFG